MWVSAMSVGSLVVLSTQKQKVKTPQPGLEFYKFAPHCLRLPERGSQDLFNGTNFDSFSGEHLANINW
jgi:hypothetical protein